MKAKDYLEINKNSWNSRTPHHLTSKFYDVEGFNNGNSTLNSIELNLLGNVKGKSILHLQCHFGLDTMSLSRLGATCTGLDLSDSAIDAAKQLALKNNLDTKFVCCNVYDTLKYVTEKFDIVYTSYGVIGWLPDLKPWASNIAQLLKPNGKLVFAEFHPVLWMFDDDFKTIKYSYFNRAPIIEEETGTYANTQANIKNTYVCWNHSIADVIDNLIECGLELKTFKEYNYSPYNCFNNTVEFEPGKFKIKTFENLLPMVFALVAKKTLKD